MSECLRWQRLSRLQLGKAFRPPQTLWQDCSCRCPPAVPASSRRLRVCPMRCRQPLQFGNLKPEWLCNFAAVASRPALVVSSGGRLWPGDPGNVLRMVKLRLLQRRFLCSKVRPYHTMGDAQTQCAASGAGAKRGVFHPHCLRDVVTIGIRLPL